MTSVAERLIADVTWTNGQTPLVDGSNYALLAAVSVDGGTVKLMSLNGSLIRDMVISTYLQFRAFNWPLSYYHN